MAVTYFGILYFFLDSWRGLWPETSAAVTQPVVVLVVTGTMAAAHRGFKASEAEKSDIFSVAARPVGMTDLIRILALCIQMVGLYAVLAAIPFLHTALSSPPGAPRISFWVISALGLVSVVGLSYTVGRVAASRFTPLIIGVLSYCLIAVMPQYSSLALWVPALTIVDQSVTASALAVKVLLAVAGVLSACTSAAARNGLRALRGRTAGSEPVSTASRLSVCSFFASMACFVLGVPMAAGTDLLQARTPEAANVVCDSSSGSHICFWKDHASFIPRIAGMAQRIHKVTEGLTSQKAVYVEKGINSQDQGIEVGYGGSAIWTGLIDSSLPRFRDCPAESETQLEKRLAASTLTAAWVEAKVRGESVLQGEYTYTGFDPTRRVRKVLRMSEADQKAQVARWLEVTSAKCGEK
ncbi:hypothetical protein ACH4D5_10460 [Streptomyces sp. NPDC018029]|uniref:hypothetical protein n=1 Tax=Streptomyces sp. NPDC018029 TaxID=3365032 RepID=UPI0037AF9E6B